MKLEPSDFTRLRAIIKKICGAHIRQQKSYLLGNRLEPLLVKYELKDFRELITLLSNSTNKRIIDDIINAVTTHETSFFRNRPVFECLQTHIYPGIWKRYREAVPDVELSFVPKCRIWSCASSTGQEPYSIAISVLKYCSSNKNCSPGDFAVLASDISPKVLQVAASGQYADYQLSRGISESERRLWFKKEGPHWKINGKARGLVEFRRINLVAPFRGIASCDIIFCRNVLIYFDHDTKARIIDRLYDRLKNHGYLILGSTENLFHVTDKFKTVRFGSSVFYQKVLHE
jgi:chemotaxis protein methyltransferase CheR